MICNYEDCSMDAKAKGYCKRHYNRLLARQKAKRKYELGDTCEKGHVIINENAQTYVSSVGNVVLRCRICNSNNGSVRTMVVGGECKRGHKLDEDNVKYRSINGGKPFVECRECNRIRDKVKRERDRERRLNNPEYRRLVIERERKRQMMRNKTAIRESEKFDKQLALEVATVTNGRYSGLNYLKLNKRAQKAWEPLAEAFDRSQAKCYRNPGPYIDYEDEATPLASEAFKLCHGCPMLVECGRFAAAFKPVVGVWAGEVWVEGRVVR